MSGDVTADSGVGALNSSAGIISISGSATGSAANYGASNTSVGTLIVKRAVGGPGSAAVAGVNSSLASSLTYVQEIEYGDLGQSPTTGPIILTDQATNVAVFYRFGSSKKTLIDSSSISNTVPVAGDVRAGVVYNNGNLTGTCQIPSATWNRPCFATSVALRHRLGFTVAGAGPLNWASSARSRSTSPLAFLILPSGMVPRKPRLAKSKSCWSAQFRVAASAALSACACGLAVGGGVAVAAEARRRAMRCGVMLEG